MKILLSIFCVVPLSSYSYSENPPPDGPYETFHENGQLEFRENYKDGEPDGPWEEFDEEGNLTKSGKTVN